MPPRTRSRGLPLAAWGFRPPCACAEPPAYADVLLVQALQISIPATVGVPGLGLGPLGSRLGVTARGHEPGPGAAGCRRSNNPLVG